MAKRPYGLQRSCPLFSLLSAVAVAEMFWEWDLFIWYRRAYLVLATVWVLVFPPRD